MTNLRDYARGQKCQIRSPVCSDNPEQTVLAHLRQIGISGMGMKAPDILGAWACSECHLYVDQKTHGGRADRDLLLLKGIARTINELVRQEKLKW